MLPSNMPAVTGRKNMESVFAGMLQVTNNADVIIRTTIAVRIGFIKKFLGEKLLCEYCVFIV